MAYNLHHIPVHTSGVRKLTLSTSNTHGHVRLSDQSNTPFQSSETYKPCESTITHKEIGIVATRGARSYLGPAEESQHTRTQHSSHGINP